MSFSTCVVYFIHFHRNTLVPDLEPCLTFVINDHELLTLSYKPIVSYINIKILMQIICTYQKICLMNMYENQKYTIFCSVDEYYWTSSLWLSTDTGIYTILEINWPITNLLDMFFCSSLALNTMSWLESTCSGLSCKGN